MKARAAAGLVFLLAQLAWVATGQRPRLWAPFHEHAVYTLRVRAGGQALDTKHALERYRLATWHTSVERDEAWETNDLDFIRRTIEAHEEHTEGPVEVELRAKVNGEPQPPWRWVR